MKFLRNVDSLSRSLALSQARIFENSVSFGIPSKIFIRSYMLSDEVMLIDSLNLNVAGLTEREVFDVVSKKITNKRGMLYSFSIMHFIGYFYRMAAYLSGYSSKQLYEYIKPDLLNRNYQTLHSLPIEEAIKEVFEITQFKIEDKYEYFRKIYKVDQTIKLMQEINQGIADVNSGRAVSLEDAKKKLL